ncbi:polyprenol monophosphomannose synthase [Blastococcus goldschmidtiae]|uniref:Polyprenol monophosphomannose synthase n=1 Tax=Blastococcus goldschmidtiae TaxID=3075546 RepID=A0ABU2K4K2_9ACTN|nr:polyprenol monophosphomannose synthase [Blastococcus sp. DSM 46792]MDT0275090.1 polyprenol monophosphomannose synthase [Blastococcus sp. DSM 46792]
MRILVVTPTYNEAENVRQHVEAVLARPARPDVLIVDDGSPDGTADIVRALAEEHPGRVELLERSGKQGLGTAYVAGFRWGLAQERFDVIVQMDVDGSHDPRAIDDLLAAIADADLVLGSRYVPGGAVANWPWSRRTVSWIGNLYARTVLRTRTRDLTGGFKAWRTDLLARLDVDSFAANGYGYQIETTYRALQAGARIVEVPITFRDRELGESKMNTGIAVEAVSAVWRIRLNPAPSARSAGSADAGDGAAGRG